MLVIHTSRQAFVSQQLFFRALVEYVRGAKSARALFFTSENRKLITDQVYPVAVLEVPLMKLYMHIYIVLSRRS